MRLARSNDVWRELFKDKPHPIEQVTLTYKDAPDGSDVTICLEAPISLFCGENGVGKSRALRAVHQALGGELDESDFRPKVGPPAPIVSCVKATLRDCGENGEIGEAYDVHDISTLSGKLKNAEGVSKIYWFDPTVQIPYLLHLLRHDSSLSDLLEGVSPKKLSKTELDEVSALVGRTYDAVEILEIADYQDHEVVPYIRANSKGAVYGAEDMGLGELSLLFFYWMLNGIEIGSVLLMEEPETFIAPKSQRTLIDFVANEANQKSIFVVVTSHSGIIAARVPNSHTNFVARHGKEVSFMRAPQRHILVDRLSLMPPRSVLVLVEDEAAALCAKALLEVGNSKYVSHCRILVAGGESEIAKVLKMIPPRDGDGVNIIGLFDGDMRDKLPDHVPWPTMCLPGRVPPEIFARQRLETNFDGLENLLNRARCSILSAFGGVDGQNHHEWLIGISKSLQISVGELFRCVALEFYLNESDSLSSFISEFENKVSSARNFG